MEYADTTPLMFAKVKVTHRMNVLLFGQGLEMRVVEGDWSELMCQRECVQWITRTHKCL